MNTLSNNSGNILLNDGWTLSNEQGTITLKVDFPNDVHSTLLAAGKITDPYWRDTETSLDWIHESTWFAYKTFILNDDLDGEYVLTFDSIDCHAIITVNDIEIGHCENQFLRYDFNITSALHPGKNTLSVHFQSNSKIAKAKQKAFPFPVPYIDWNCRIPNYNFLRKAQCHSGWDWNIALSPLGCYGDINLRKVSFTQLNDVLFKQHHSEGLVTLEVSLAFESFGVCRTSASIDVAGHIVYSTVQAYPGRNQATLMLKIPSPELWWPVGYGEQILYTATLCLGDEERQYTIGFRDVELIDHKDEIGHRFAFSINGHEIFMKGANWIPADALPSRATPEVVRDLLQSAVDANMNMLRVWGGGQYEHDWFYDLCSELGILIWHDFMFACNLYPAADKAWLDLVRREARQQIRRLSSQPCMTVWCGDNELIGALNWFEESKSDRDRYLVMYDRLNHALEEAIADEDSGLPFWPSSPSVGRLNFGDGWHDDTSGDMHFWDVWHSSKDFEHYRTVQPRFCSEFGFQSLPSMRVIESFTNPEDRNVSSHVMDVHQRNPGGNSRIVETLSRYFHFPDGFEEMVYLSQVSQGLAMKTAIEYWRVSKPRCMGTLYWQLNDTWPVASWSSLEYGGAWKLTHYLAKRFYDPILVTAQPDKNNEEIIILASNDTRNVVSLSIELKCVNVTGGIKTIGEHTVDCPTDRAIEVARLPTSCIPDDSFLYFSWTDDNNHYHGENEFLPNRPKEYAFLQPNISVDTKTTADGAKEVRIISDVPVLFVTYDHGGDCIYSDNCFTLLPQIPKILTVVRERSKHLPESTAHINYMRG